MRNNHNGHTQEENKGKNRERKEEAKEEEYLEIPALKVARSTP
jgi:hypothetical protein